jgi:hypothetical protein
MSRGVAARLIAVPSLEAVFRLRALIAMQQYSDTAIDFTAVEKLLGIFQGSLSRKPPIKCPR